MPPIPVEVCLHSTSEREAARAAAAAYAGGAARVELCAAMEHDGLTPRPEHVRAARHAFGDRPGLVVMIRPRPGGFHYTDEELGLMREQIHAAAEAGADGVALGAVRPDTDGIDVPALEGLIAEAKTRRLAVTFHRAFDVLPDPLTAVDTLRRLSVDRVLTSGVPWGQAGTALDGAERLRTVIAHAGSDLEVVVGGSVNAHTLPALLRALPLQAGQVSVHAYSSTLENGRTTEAAVQALVWAARRSSLILTPNPGRPV